MPAANIGAKWISGNLVVFDKLTGSSIATFIDLHGAVDSLGSETEYIKS